MATFKYDNAYNLPMENGIWFFGFLIAVYVVYRIFTQPPSPKVNTGEFNDVLTSEKYKVKGQYEK